MTLFICICNTAAVTLSGSHRFNCQRFSQSVTGVVFWKSEAEFEEMNVKWFVPPETDDYKIEFGNLHTRSSFGVKFQFAVIHSENITYK